MENNPNNDATTPENNPAAGQKPEMSLADQILAMKAERDAKAKAQSESNQTTTPNVSVLVTQEEPKTLRHSRKTNNLQKTLLPK